MIDLNELAKMLKTKRKESGLSQEEFAEVMGFTGSYISRLENGKISPTFKSLERISEQVGIKAKLFFG
ncbi:helix-turn-helix domain-containing protein [Bacillus altitudinis]|uniref:helix-turn-helix domain-containing protein n=1 Tax=Bacillus TaxID=1386 RepID=UPI00071764D7|nr:MULTISPECIES: helix-turn-helix transcriptional regulator [Bacillus]KRU14787.1 XRE family transcriptional regulator [Bacillus pumilus]PWN86082.1 XRE family transcriptional regulator [Bacillus altitudinis]